MLLPAPCEILTADVQNYPPILDLFIIFPSRLVEIARDITLYVPPKHGGVCGISKDFRFSTSQKFHDWSFRGQIY